MCHVHMHQITSTSDTSRADELRWKISGHLGGNKAMNIDSYCLQPRMQQAFLHSMYVQKATCGTRMFSGSRMHWLYLHAHVRYVNGPCMCQDEAWLTTCDAWNHACPCTKKSWMFQITDLKPAIVNCLKLSQSVSVLSVFCVKHNAEEVRKETAAAIAAAIASAAYHPLDLLKWTEWFKSIGTCFQRSKVYSQKSDSREPL